MRPLALVFVLAACAAAPEPAPAPVPAPSAEPDVAAPPRPVSRLKPPLRAELVHTLPPAVASPLYGGQLVAIGDWDGDGRTDLAVNADLRKDRSKSWMVLSPSTAAVLADVEPSQGEQPESRRLIAAPGDANGDGRADVAVLTSFAFAGDSWFTQLELYGSAAPKPIWSELIHDPNGTRAVALAAIGDVDRDGARDLAIGFPPWSGAAVAGQVQIRSGRDGHEIHAFTGDPGDPPPWKFGTEVARAADADGDGVDDVAVVAEFRDGADTFFAGDDPLPRLEFRSSATGERVRVDQRNAVLNVSSWHSKRLRSGDVDGDGSPDLVMRTLRNVDVVEVISGRDGKVVHELTPHPDPNGREEYAFPSDVAVADDLDGDGVRELLLGHAEVGSDNGADYGAIYLQSPRTNELLLAIWGTPEDAHLGAAVAWLGDTDGDGAPEFAALTQDGVRVWAVRGAD